jgi:hypothetical protein
LTKWYWPCYDGSASAPACVRRSQRFGHGTLACFVLSVLWLAGPALDEVALACCGCGAQHLEELHGYSKLVCFVLDELWLWTPALASAPACVRRSQRVGHGTLACFVLGVLWLWGAALDKVALVFL